VRPRHQNLPTNALHTNGAGRGDSQLAVNLVIMAGRSGEFGARSTMHMPAAAAVRDRSPVRATIPARFSGPHRALVLRGLNPVPGGPSAPPLQAGLPASGTASAQHRRATAAAGFAARGTRLRKPRSLPDRSCQPKDNRHLSCTMTRVPTRGAQSDGANSVSVTAPEPNAPGFRADQRELAADCPSGRRGPRRTRRRWTLLPRAGPPLCGPVARR
jgi:hypothetical protein